MSEIDRELAEMQRAVSADTRHSLAKLETFNRWSNLEKHCEFGLGFVDDALGCLRPQELAVIAARTGVGKTQLATSIARHNCAQGKRVYLIALEAESDEVLRRLKYQTLAKYFFANRSDYPAHIKLTFAAWAQCQFPELRELEEFVNAQLAEELKGLEIYSPAISDFTKNNFATVYEDAARDGYGLIILDHLHYISSDDRENEFDHTKRLMWKLRDAINKHNVPLIAFSHLRKDSRQDDSLVPNIEQVHGSSEITKQANHVISMASVSHLPRKDKPAEKFQAPVGSTLFRVLKSRMGNAGASKYAALSQFNLDTNNYEPGYVPYQTDRWATSLYPMRYQDFEHWMGLAREARA